MSGNIRVLCWDYWRFDSEMSKRAYVVKNAVELSLESYWFLKALGTSTDVSQ